MAFILRNNFNTYTGNIFVNYKNAHSYFYLNAVTTNKSNVSKLPDTLEQYSVVSNIVQASSSKPCLLVLHNN